MAAYPHVQGLTPGERKRLARRNMMMLARLMDSAFVIPGTRVRAGLDSLLGLVPGIGDLASGAIGLFLILQARELGASRWLQARMFGNLLIDTTVGSVPLLGDAFDVLFKANLRNIRLLEKELGESFIDGEGRVMDPDVIDVPVRDADVIEGTAREKR